MQRVREVADPTSRCAGGSRPCWIQVPPRVALPDPRSRVAVGRHGQGALRRRRVVCRSLQRSVASSNAASLWASSPRLACPVVDTARGIEPELGDRDDVDRVHPAVPRTREPVAVLLMPTHAPPSTTTEPAGAWTATACTSLPRTSLASERRRGAARSTSRCARARSASALFGSGTIAIFVIRFVRGQ